MKMPDSRHGAVLAVVILLLSGCDRFTSTDTRLQRASASLQAGEYQSALIDLRKATEKEPGNIQAQLLLVDVLIATGDLQTARVQLDRAIAAGAPHEITDNRLLNLLIASRDLAQARKDLAASDTLSAAARATYEGQILLLEQKPAEAQEAFQRALAADAGFTEAALGRIESLAALNQAEAARTAAKTLIARDPGSGRAWFYLGMLAARDGDFGTARADFSKSVDNGSGMTREQRVQAHVGKIESELASGLLNQARASLPQFEAVSNGAPVVSLMRARIALASGDTNSAVNELRAFTQAAPQNMPGRLLLVSSLQQQGSLEQAFAEAVRTTSEFPQRDEPRLALAAVQLRLGRMSDAEDTLRPLAAQSPPNPNATAMLAEIRVRGGDATAGVALLEQSLTGNPGNSSLKLQLATAYISAGDARRALDVLALVQEPELAAARDRLHVIANAAVRGPEAVQRELDAALAQHADDVDLLVMAAGHAANTGQLDLARTRLLKALQLRPDSPELMLTLARLEISAGRTAEAELQVKSALAKAPNDATAMVLMASISAQRGQESEVEAWLNRARLANPGALDASLALARKAYLRGESTEAHNILADLVTHAPDNAAARVALAELTASQGKTEEALRSLRETALRHPELPLVPLAMARVQLASKDAAGARRSLQQSLKGNPGWLPAATLLTGLEARSGNLEDALAVIKQVRTANPRANSADLLEGELYSALRRHGQAAQAFMAAYKTKAGSSAAVRALQEKVRAGAGNPDLELRDWLNRSPADSGARRTLAEYYLSIGRSDEAITQLEPVVAARPNDAVALNNLAWLYDQKADKRALATAEKAYRAAPTSLAIADTYGWILVRSGKLQEGLPLLEKAAQTSTDNIDTQFHFASALVQAGEKARAAAILRKIADSGSKLESAAKARHLLADLGN